MQKTFQRYFHKPTIATLLVALLLMSGCAKVAPTSDSLEANQLTPHLAHYQRLAGQPWPTIMYQEPIKPLTHAQNIPIIRARLNLLGDYPERTYFEDNTFYDPSLVSAVKQFQYRHGLKGDGVIGQSTLDALNVSPAQRLQQLAQAVHGWDQLKREGAKGDYLQVNLPSYQLRVIEKDQPAFSMRVVVGSPKWPTPTLNSELRSVVINPRWNIPRNITEKELIHKIVNDPTYLEQENIKIYDGWQRNAQEVDASTVDWARYVGKEDLPYRLIQTAGQHNALGRVKFTFPNKEHIYLHDTPHKGAFELEQRNLSHGCIRLQQPERLLFYLIDSGRLRSPELAQKAYEDRGQPKHFGLTQPMPLFITNISSWVDERGLLQFRAPYPAG